jgi:SNF2 family DNA or RNA helicase
LSRWWNPAVEDRCNGRARRIGQTRPVTVHPLLVLCPDGHKSFDENLHALLERKRDLMRAALVRPLADEAEQANLLADTLNA